MPGTRSNFGTYAYEWDRDEHHKAAELLHHCESMVVISGYACPLYEELYDRYGWQRFDYRTYANGGKRKYELIWLSPRTWKHLQQQGEDKPS